MCLLRRHFDGGVEIVSPPGDVFSFSARTPAGSAGSHNLEGWSHSNGCIADTAGIFIRLVELRSEAFCPAGLSTVLLVRGRKPVGPKTAERQQVAAILSSKSSWNKREVRSSGTEGNWRWH